MTDRTSLADLSVAELTDQLASGAPVPGGGSAAAVAGAMAAAVVGMVVELSVGRAELAEHGPALREIGARAAALRKGFLELADRDATAFAGFMAARRLPRDDDAARAARRAAMTAAAQDAALVPLEIARAGEETLGLAMRVAPISNPNVASDAGVGIHLAIAAIRGAALNVRINVPLLAPDDPLLEKLPAELARLEAAAMETHREAAAGSPDSGGPTP